MDRNAAWQVVSEFVKDQGLRRHMLAVEAAMRLYAEKLGADADEWGLAGLLHDFDWELHPDLERHPRAPSQDVLAVEVADPHLVASRASVHERHGTG